METRKFTAILSLITVLQILNFLTLNLPQGLVLLTSLAIALIYLTYEGSLKISETVLSTIVFTVTGLLVAVITKNIVTDVCETAKAVQDSGMGSVLPQKEACRSIFQIWIDLLGSNPVNEWEFWSMTLAASIGSIQLYRKVNEWRNEEEK